MADGKLFNLPEKPDTKPDMPTTKPDMPPQKPTEKPDMSDKKQDTPKRSPIMKGGAMLNAVGTKKDDGPTLEHEKAAAATGKGAREDVRMFDDEGGEDFGSWDESDDEDDDEDDDDDDEDEDDEDDPWA